MIIDPLIVDVYQGDGPKKWRELAAAGPPWHGVIIKATQGLYYHPAAWLHTNWMEIHEAGGGRCGLDWFRGAYHYLDVRQDGAAQADYFLSAINTAGGWARGDLWPMVDVEHAGQRTIGSSYQVIDCVRNFATRVHDVLGRDVMLYGGSWLAELSITSRMCCKYLAVARYTQTLPTFVYERIGWDRASLALWQYCGDGVGYLSGYPREAPGCGKVDISAMVLPGGLSALRLAL